eukprot:TRINITY_DN39886_c0_g1_i1.p1 TRINITY_DN39886_c0_g1~~TRINITY_DN39886_c0_g1_i1.p1  ORF type:complete len:703 (-),score=136.11 TRINITY_DN39886_c0_g1_i1:129-2204(-)
MALHAACFLAACLLPVVQVWAAHCYATSSCEACVADSRGAPCAWCKGTNSCQMATDVCEDGLVGAGGDCSAEWTPKVLPGDPFFKDFSELLSHNPVQRNYGVSVTDIDGDGNLEAVVAGFGAANLAFKWDGSEGHFKDVASDSQALQDASGKAIGVAACDVDGDGYEELYVLNTDQYSGQTTTSDRLLDRNPSAGSFSDIFSQSQNEGNYVAGRSCACVDRTGNGVYGVMVANYGYPMKLFEVDASQKVMDVAPDIGVSKTTGGRALIAGPIISNRFDIFANNEGYAGGGRRLGSGSDPRRLGHRLNFFFVNKGDGTYMDAALALGILDGDYTGRGTALIDANGDGLLDIVYGNWQGRHRLFVQEEDSQGCVSFVDRATSEMAVPSNVRTVIVADFDNDGYEEIFWNNIPGSNRLFRKLPTDADWVQVNIGDALEADGYGTGAAVGDFDGDGLLELFVSHGESASQPMSYFRPRKGQGNHWIRIAPRTSQGAPARGALVTLLESSGRSQVRVIDPGSGYLCQQEPVAHFGLGGSTAVKSVTVQWPDGAQLTIQSPAVDKLHDIAKPAGAAVVPALSITLTGSCLKRSGPPGFIPESSQESDTTTASSKDSDDAPSSSSQSDSAASTSTDSALIPKSTTESDDTTPSGAASVTSKASADPRPDPASANLSCRVYNVIGCFFVTLAAAMQHFW